MSFDGRTWKQNKQTRMGRLLLDAALVIGMLAVIPVAQAEVWLRVCNSGDIPVYAAVVSEAGVINPLKFHGWQKIEPGNRMWTGTCLPFFIGGTNVNWHYILFGIYDKNDRFGVVVYNFDGRQSGTTDAEFCVPPPGKEGCKKAPVSGGVRIYRNGEIDYKFEVKPTLNDTIAVYLDESRVPESAGSKLEDGPQGIKIGSSGLDLPTGYYVVISEFQPSGNLPPTAINLAARAFEVALTLKKFAILTKVYYIKSPLRVAVGPDRTGEQADRMLLHYDAWLKKKFDGPYRIHVEWF